MPHNADDSPCPPPSTAALTAQQRAARVTAAFYQAKTLHIRDVQRLTGLSRRAAIDLLENLSGALPITDVGAGKWLLIEPERLGNPAPATRPMFKIHPNTRALIAFALAQSGTIKTSEIARRAGLTVPEVRWLLQRLQLGGLPIAERGLDEWMVTPKP